MAISGQLHNSAKAIRFVFCVFFCSFFVGCAVSTRTQYEDNDGFLPETFFKSIKKNRTFKEVVVNNLGEPVERLRTDNGDEIYSYAFTKAHYKHHSLFFIARYNTVDRDERYFHVVFNDGRVKKFWWNNIAEVSPRGEVVSRWPNEAGTDYSLRVIKNAEPDKTNFVLTRTIRPMALRTRVETENETIPMDSIDVLKDSDTDMLSNEVTSAVKKPTSIQLNGVIDSEATVVRDSMHSSRSSSVPIVDAVPIDGLFPDGKSSSP